MSLFSLVFSLFLNLQLLFLNSVFAMEFETTIKDYQFNSSSKVVIDEETIRKTQAKDVFALISTQANVSFFNQNFQLPQIFLRGADASHILIMVDGVPFYDPSWASKTFNLNAIDIQTVRRIEILKGGQSVIYGGQALAGVIKIETYASDPSSRIRAQLGAGNYQEKRASLMAQQHLDDNFTVGLGGRWFQRANPSPVKDSGVTYDQNTHNADLFLASNTEAVQWLGKAYYILDHAYSPTTALVSGRFTVGDTPDLAKRDQLYGGSVVANLAKTPLQPRLTLSTQNSGRSYVQSTATVTTPTGVGQYFTSNLFLIRMDLKLYSVENFDVVSGFSYSKEKMTFESIPDGILERTGTSELRAVFAKATWKVADPVSLEGGARVDAVDSLDSNTGHHLGVTLWQNTKLEWTTGYRAPSPAQKFGVYPNPDLKPETAQTYSLSHDWTIEKTNLSITLFDTYFNNLISVVGAPPNQRYDNVARTQTRGVEFAATYKPDEISTYQATYGYQEPWDVGNARRLNRRPNVTGALRYLGTLNAWSGMLEGVGTGERVDGTTAASRVTLEAYFQINASLSYKLDTEKSLSLRASNIFSQRPELSSDYYGDPASYLLTFNWNR